MSTIRGGLSNASVQFSVTPASGYLAGNAVQIPGMRLLANFQPGTLADQIDGLAAVPLTLSSSTPQTVDLSTLVDVLTGASLTVARVVFVAAKVTSAVDGTVLKLGAAGSNEWDGLGSNGGTVNVYPSSPNAANDGFTVFSAPGTTAMPVDGTHHLLKCDPGSAAMTAVLLIGTRSA